jgi:hypothetical protein
MKILVPKTAIDHGILRVLLSEIPVESGLVKAYRTNESGKLLEEIGIATLYGKGQPSLADEQTMLQFRIHKNLSSPLKQGEIVEICLENALTSTAVPAHFNVIQVT